MPIYSYALGTTYPPTNVETLLAEAGYLDGTVPVGRYFEAAAFTTRLDAGQSGQGSPRAVWTFSVLTQTMVNTLRGICPGFSASVFITTRNNTGTFETYSGTMIWPAADQMQRRQFRGKYTGLEFEFRNLQQIYVLDFQETGNSQFIPPLLQLTQSRRHNR